MKTIRDYLESVSDKEMLVEIVNNFEKYQENGEIGECRLRSIERWIISNICGDVKAIRPTSWFLRITMESYRILYEKERENNEEFRSRISDVVNHF